MELQTQDMANVRIGIELENCMTLDHHRAHCPQCLAKASRCRGQPQGLAAKILGSRVPADTLMV